VKKAAKTLKDDLYGILNYVEYRITNATVEGLNSQIETLWKSACGFRNKKRFRTAILFHLGGLDLFPSTHLKPGSTCFMVTGFVVETYCTISWEEALNGINSIQQMA